MPFKPGTIGKECRIRQRPLEGATGLGWRPLEGYRIRVEILERECRFRAENLGRGCMIRVEDFGAGVGSGQTS